MKVRWRIGLHRGLLTAVALLAAASLVSCRRAAPPGPPAQLSPAAFSGQDAYAEASAFVSLGPRVSGTPGAEAAAHYLFKRLQDIGLNPSLDVFRDATPDGDKTFRNVTATLRGTGTGLVVIASHYDTKSGIARFVGANDSGSSTAVLLALADVLRRSPAIRPTVLLAFLDGEECVREYGKKDGLHGSRRLLLRMQGRNEAKSISAFILLDMVGDRHLSVAIPANSTPALVSIAFDAARAERERLRFSLSRGEVLDDHVPFIEAGVPAIDLIDFEYGTAPGRNDYWHTAQDTIDKLSPDSLQIIGRVVLRMINTL